MLKTPVYNLKNYPNVYEPSEDTFLFLDVIEDELSFIIALNPRVVVEIGSGSGVLITGLASELKTVPICFATDVNESACLSTLETAKLNGVCVECVYGNLLDSFKSNVCDVILFNPPYVVTVSEEVVGNGLNRAWAGGLDGREIIDKFLSNLPELLSQTGVCYLLVIKENNPHEIVNIGSMLGLRSEIIKERKILGEYLYIIKFSKIN